MIPTLQDPSNANHLSASADDSLLHNDRRPQPDVLPKLHSRSIILLTLNPHCPSPSPPSPPQSHPHSSSTSSSSSSSPPPPPPPPPPPRPIPQRRPFRPEKSPIKSLHSPQPWCIPAVNPTPGNYSQTTPP
eukprot:746899-Hanusia_phi.AAC.1